MKKSMVALLLASAFTFGAAGLSFAAKPECTVDGVNGNKVTVTCEKCDGLKAGDKVKAAKAECTIDGVDGNKVTMTCGKSEGMKAGETIKIRAAHKRAAAEGC
jgi:hypothetical protein